MNQTTTDLADIVEAISAIASDAHARGAASVARELDVPRQTLVSVIAGTSRLASRELVLARWRAVRGAR